MAAPQRRHLLPAALLLAFGFGCSQREETNAPDGLPKEEKAAGGKKELTNSVGMRLVEVPAGRFDMGSTEEEVEGLLRRLSTLATREWLGGVLRPQAPRHEVELPGAFYLGAFEVTQGQYRAVTGEGPSHFSKGGGGREEVAGLDTSDFPVERVSWLDAVEFCARLSARPEEKAAGRVYRLPTEAEWEYACRAGTSTPFHTGTKLSSRQANFDGVPGGGPSLRQTCKAGSYPPNAWGLYDMHGNVGEWCQDWYGEGYYAVSPRKGPKGPATGAHRVIRGGSWVDRAWLCRADIRGQGPPRTRSNLVGFRVAYHIANR
jgi:formylglycine-generating enzyme required for sulfatase activity